MIIMLVILSTIAYINFNQLYAMHGKPSPAMAKYFSLVFSGNLSTAQMLFTNNPNDRGINMLKEKFNSRFIKRTNSLDLSEIKSPIVVAITKIFQDYWRDALLQKLSLVDLNLLLKQQLDNILQQNTFVSALDDEDKLMDNVVKLIEKEGYFALSGKTPPLFELMIWTKNEVSSQKVQLTDGNYDVKVNCLRNFVSKGWANFATFGMSSTGGWAKKDGLYCLCDDYDLSSDHFQVSFLKHEARHFADYQKFPELQSSDLEYRAKLTELTFAGSDTQKRLTRFISAANKIENAPHPLANWHIKNDFLKHLFEGKDSITEADWQQLSKEIIQATAQKLLKSHDQKLTKAGASSTKGFITLELSEL